MTRLRACLFYAAVLCLLCAFGCSGGGGDSQASGSVAEEKGRIVFFGDSLTDGYTLPREQAYPALIQEKLNSESLPYITKNAGVSGNTSADGLGRIAQELVNPVAVFVLALGVNDAKNDAAANQTEYNLQQILDRVKAASPSVKFMIAGVDLPALMSRRQSQEYGAMYQRLAAANNALLIPNFLAGVAGNPSLNLADQIHPNAEGHRIVAETIWAGLRTLIKS
jgi:acyl-CoA thioesterase I